MELVLEVQAQVQLVREPQQVVEDRAQADVAGVPDDADLDHPVSASVPCSARTRSAMPAASSPHCASCVARGLTNAELYLDGAALPIANSITGVSDLLQRRLGMTRGEFFNTYFTGQKELNVMAAMKPTQRAQFLSRVLGYERLRQPSYRGVRNDLTPSSDVPDVPGENIFGFTDPTDVGKPGDTGLASENTGRAGKRMGRYFTLQSKTELGRTLDVDDARLPGGVRLHVVLPPISPTGLWWYSGVATSRERCARALPSR